MITVTLWLLINCSNQAACITLERFPSRAACEETRSQLVQDVTTVYRVNLGCIRATVARAER